jgi:CRISPR-associated protein Cmr2
MPNRVVALLPANTGAAAAKQASAAAREAWRDWVRRVMDLSGKHLPETPGFPCAQWVRVPAEAGGYEARWLQAQRLLAGRRRVRDFPATPDEEWRRRVLCSLAPRWPAERQAPPRTPEYEQRTPLSAVGWVKRRWHQMNGTGGFPSTASIASGPYRLAVMRRLGDQDVAEAVRVLDEARRAVEEVLGGAGRETPVKGVALGAPESGPGAWFARSGGPWVYPEQWRPETLVREAQQDRSRDEPANKTLIQSAAGDGLRAARRLRDLMEQGRPPAQLASYLAVVVQDLDGMGLFLSGKASDVTGREIKVEPDEHQRVSRELLRMAVAQRKDLETAELLGVPVYAGGDDLLFFSPAATALDAAEECHDQVIRQGLLPTASTAVLFFHYHASIQRAMSQARELLEQAKKVSGKHGLAVGYLRRSGVTAVSIQPWAGQEGGSSASRFGLFAREHEPRLSPRLVADLERDAGELGQLAQVSREMSGPKAGLYKAELARLVRRHAGTGNGGGRDAVGRIAEALDWLGRHEHAPGLADPARSGGPEAAARVGVFLRQEAR